MAYINGKKILFCVKQFIKSAKFTTKKIDSNGTYKASDDGVDGYSSVEVALSAKELTVTPTEERQELTPTDTDYYSKVIVEPIPPDYIQPTLQEKTAKVNGPVTPDVGYDGLSKVIVDVSISDNSPLPIEISTEAEMTDLLETAANGSVYKYVGETSTIYESGGIYIVEEEVL